MQTVSKVEDHVKKTYAEGAQERVEALCCPVSYDPRFLEIIPSEVIERDYGCGDPSQHLHSGETVLDLGSGTGKICFIAAQVVGPTGRVIGVDMTHDMLEVARRNAPVVAERGGYSNVEFRRGHIQDLGLDLDRLDRELEGRTVSNAEELFAANDLADNLRKNEPMIADDSVDVVVSNCVLNLVRGEDKEKLFREIFRVLRRGGHAVISDIVSDEEIPLALQEDDELWSGCISGSFTESGFLQAFEKAGFYGIRVLVRQSEPWQVVDGIEFRSLTVEAFKGKEGPCLERNQAVIYRGPFLEVLDDDEHVYRRGERMAVCDKTFQILTRAPYAEHFDPVEPLEAISLQEAKAFDCDQDSRRDARESKGDRYRETAEAACCGPSCC